MTMKKTKTIVIVAGALLAACGSAQKTSKGEMNDQARSAPPPPANVVEGQTVQRKVTKEAQNDFAAAVAFFKEQEKGGWTTASCTAAADKFQNVAKSHDKVVEAWFNAGVSYHKCGDTKHAESMYQKALGINPGHSPSLANLGEIYFRGGNEAVGEQYFQKAIQADKKTTAGRNNLAWIYYNKLRKTNDESYIKKAEEELSRVLAVDNDNIVAYTILALVYMQGADKNRSRLDVAKLLLEEGKKRNDKYPQLYNAWGLLHMKKSNVGEALKMFRQAVEMDPNFVEARLNVAQVVLSFRKYQEAEENFRFVLAKKDILKDEKYDATVGLAVALRGQKKIDEAAQLYEEAMTLQPERGDAYYNMGLLWKDFKTNSDDPKTNKNAFTKAKGFFNQFMGKQDADPAKREEAKDNIDACDKNIAALDQAIEIMRNAPPPAPATPAPAPAGAKPPGGK
jgi:tetratricopeptide (TPR) repeat protein